MERGQWPGLVAAVAVVLIVAGALIAKWYLHRGAEPAGALEQAQSSAVAQPEPDAGAQCTVRIGAADDGAPTAQAVVLPVGAVVLVAAGCPVGMQVVDLVVSTAPPIGVLGVAATQNQGDNWVWDMEIPAELAGQTLTFYGYANGRPASEPVTLTIAGG